MIQLPDCMPTHHRDEIARGVTWSLLQVGLNGQEVVGDSIGDGSLHDMRVKLAEWEIMVSWPRHHPTVIGGTWELIVAHGPTAPPAIKVPGYPNLLRRGSAPWRGGTVTICS